MAIFNSYVKLPEGTSSIFRSQTWRISDSESALLPRRSYLAETYRALRGREWPDSFRGGRRVTDFHHMHFYNLYNLIQLQFIIYIQMLLTYISDVTTAEKRECRGFVSQKDPTHKVRFAGIINSWSYLFTSPAAKFSGCFRQENWQISPGISQSFWIDHPSWIWLQYRSPAGFSEQPAAIWRLSLSQGWALISNTWAFTGRKDKPWVFVGYGSLFLLPDCPRTYRSRRLADALSPGQRSIFGAASLLISFNKTWNWGLQSNPDTSPTQFVLLCPILKRKPWVEGP